jgi:peptidase E
MGGGGFSMEPDNLLLDKFVLSLAGSDRPQVCFVPTASGDSERYVAGFCRAFAVARRGHCCSERACAPLTLACG